MSQSIILFLKNIQISDYMLIAIFKNPSLSKSMKAENLQQC
jgi:hypothetical protein